MTIVADVRPQAVAGPDWFVKPGHEFWPSVYWFWHHQPTEAELRRQVDEIAAAGFGTLLIQPRMAFPIEHYLDADYLAAYRAAVGFAKDAGLKVGIYDDYNWMTGHAGGRTVAGRPELRERHLLWSEAAADGGGVTATFSEVGGNLLAGLGKPGRQWYYEGGAMVWSDWTVVAALAHPVSIASPDEIRDVSSFARVAKQSDSGCAVHVALDRPLPAGHVVTVFVSTRCATSRMINYLMPEAADRFVEVGYEPYHRAAGEFFGDPILYTFFDHPHAGFYGWKEIKGDVFNSLMYADVLKETFERKHGRPLPTTLLALIRSVGPETARWRGDFFGVYSDLAHGNFLGRLSTWTKEHGIGLAGHEILSHVGAWGLNDGFAGIDPRATIGVDYFDVDRYRTDTTVDASNFNAQLSTKMGDSVARANGRSRCIVEQYAVAVRPTGGVWAVGQWELTFETLRAQAIRLHLLGARQFLFHGYYQTDGWDNDPQPFSNPRFDFAPGINFEPWFPLLAGFSAESARLSAFLEADPATEVAVLYPRQTARVAGPHNVHGAHTGAWCKGLFEAGVEYLLLDERDLAKATVSGGKLIVGGLAYRALVLPAISHLANARTLEVIAQFVAAGGIVVASGPLVAHVYDDPSGASAARAAKLLNEVLHFAEAPDAPAIQALAAKLTPDLPIRSPSPAPATLRQWRGRDRESSRLVLFNDGREPLRVAIGLGSKPVSLERWRPESGAVEPWAWVAVGDSGAEAIIVLQPNELFCLRSAAATKGEGRVVATPGSLDRFGRTPDGRLTASLTFRTGETPEVDLAAEAKPRVTAAGKDVQVHALSAGQWRAAPPVAPGSPIILSDGWTLRAGEGAAVPIAVDRGWEQQGFDAFSGVGVYEVEFAVTAAQAAVTWELVLPAVHTTASATLNGTAIGTRIAYPYRLQISANILRIGSNRLMIEVRNTAGNRYYANTPYRGPVADPSGLAAAPRLEPVTSMTVEF